MAIKLEVIDQVESFKSLGNILLDDMRCPKKGKNTIAMAKEAFFRKRRLLYSEMCRS